MPTELIVINGVPGAGKTTLATELARALDRRVGEQGFD